MEPIQPTVAEPSSSHATIPPPPDLAGRITRALALIVDALVGAALGYPVGFWIGETLFQVGGQGRLIGLVVAVLYFGLCESRIGGGRSIGKRLLGIRVVGADGHPLPVGRAFVRASLFLLPIFLKGIGFSRLTPLATTALAVIGIAGFGLGVAVPVTLVFHRRTKQGIHDLVAGAYVVGGRAAGSAISLRAARWPWVFSAVWMAGVAVAVVVGLVTPNTEQEIPPGVVQMLGDEVGVKTWTVSWSEHWGADAGEPPRPLRFAGLNLAYGGPEENGPLMQRMARGLIENDPRAASADHVKVIVRRGWDIGFASFRTSESRIASPREWLAEPTAEGGSAGRVP